MKPDEALKLCGVGEEDAQSVEIKELPICRLSRSRLPRHRTRVPEGKGSGTEG